MSKLQVNDLSPVKDSFALKDKMALRYLLWFDRGA